MNKLSITIDVGKLRKERISTRNYTTNQGQPVSIKEMKLDIVPLKEEKLIKSGDTWDMVKVAFVAEALTKEEQASKTKSNIVGDAIEFRNKEVSDKNPYESKVVDSGTEISPDEIPW